MARTVRSQSRKDMTLQLGLASLAAASKLEKQGFLLDEWAQRPEGKPPPIPRDVTEVSDPALMRLFEHLSRWQKYLALQLAAAQVDERYANAVVERVKAFTQISNRTEKHVETMKALAFSDEGYLDALNAQSEAYSYRKMVEALYNNIERDSFGVSREITRRSNGGR